MEQMIAHIIKSDVKKQAEITTAKQLKGYFLYVARPAGLTRYIHVARTTCRLRLSKSAVLPICRTYRF
jgi:hypothetical protein